MRKPQLIPAALAVAGMAVLASASGPPAARAGSSTGSSISAISSLTAGTSSKSSSNWAGYVGSNLAFEFMDEVNVTFTVPHVNCAGSVGPATKNKSAPGWHAAFWVGLDGYFPGGSPAVEQDGVIAFCPTRASTATYRMFWEMAPAGPLFTRQVVKAGDEITVDTSVVTPNRTYQFLMQDLTRNSSVTTRATCARGITCNDATAEIITEAPGFGPDNGNGLADTGTVHYVNAAASYSGLHYGIPFGDLPVLIKDTMSPKMLPGIIRPGGFSGAAGPTDFSTFWTPPQVDVYARTGAWGGPAVRPVYILLNGGREFYGDASIPVTWSRWTGSSAVATGLYGNPAGPGPVYDPARITLTGVRQHGNTLYFRDATITARGLKTVHLWYGTLKKATGWHPGT